jgi:hypothetical protein
MILLRVVWQQSVPSCVESISRSDTVVALQQLSSGSVSGCASRLFPLHRLAAPDFHPEICTHVGAATQARVWGGDTLQTSPPLG